MSKKETSGANSSGPFIHLEERGLREQHRRRRDSAAGSSFLAVSGGLREDTGRTVRNQSDNDFWAVSYLRQWIESYLHMERDRHQKMIRYRGR